MSEEYYTLDGRPAPWRIERERADQRAKAQGIDASKAVVESARPYGFRKLLEAVKATVPVERLATDVGAHLNWQGSQLRGSGVCHGGNNVTAFVVYPDQGSWHCFSCNSGGDVLDLYMAIHRIVDTKCALIDLAGEYGVEVQDRPEEWHRWDSEKTRRRGMVRAVLAETYRRRFFRVYGTYLKSVEPSARRRAEAQAFWDDLWPLALTCAEWRLAR